MKSVCGVALCLGVVGVMLGEVKGMAKCENVDNIKNEREKLIDTFVYLTGEFPCRIANNPLHIPNWKEEFMLVEKHLSLIRDCSDRDIYDHMRQAAVAVFGFRFESFVEFCSSNDCDFSIQNTLSTFFYLIGKMTDLLPYNGNYNVDNLKQKLNLLKDTPYSILIKDKREFKVLVDLVCSSYPRSLSY
jgi:hypothetical protein